MISLQKKCSQCGIIGNKFNKNKNRKDGYEHRCQPCSIKNGREYREKVRKIGDTYQTRDPNRVRRTIVDWRNENKDRIRSYKQRVWFKKYNLSIHERKQMIINQNNKCAICERDGETLKKGLSVDHCHRTGKVRSLLCTHCNTGLGRYFDNPILLMKAARYIINHS